MNLNRNSCSWLAVRPNGRAERCGGGGLCRRSRDGSSGVVEGKGFSHVLHFCQTSNSSTPSTTIPESSFCSRFPSSAATTKSHPSISSASSPSPAIILPVPTSDDKHGSPITNSVDFLECDCNDTSFAYPGRLILFKNLNFGIDLDSRIAIQKRGENFWTEFELFVVDLLVGLVVNVALVGMLAPYVRIGQPSVSKGFLGGGGDIGDIVDI
ncbi:hypothetical protein QYF36_002636 [Acer negundo]|nr:hypothetical protein QYF36_002636 [Acer negundo]